jgi:hypothetical protein
VTSDITMPKLIQIGIAFTLIAGVIALFDFIRNPSGSPVRTTLERARSAVVDQYRTLSGTAPPTEEPKPAEPPKPAARRRAPSRATAAPVQPSAPPVLPADPAGAPRVEALPAATAAAAPPPPRGRSDRFHPGPRTSWTAYDVLVNEPMLIRAAGQVVSGTDAAGPNGIEHSAYEQDLASRGSAAANRRVIPDAPYLSLIGRVCSGEVCSEPFLVGSHRVLCPSEVKVRGTLQLWTNNYTLVDGMQTSLNYSRMYGGFSFYTEPAPAGACTADGPKNAEAPSALTDAAALAAGRVLRHPEFRISSSQSSWKPFYVPLSEPLTIRASGEMRPRGGADPTGPNGIAVSSPVWAYPTAREVVVDAQHPLFHPSLPYQALIGRLCGTDGCGRPFLVGTERTLCPAASRTDRLELWINHIIAPRGLLGSQTPLTLDAFTLQTRRGEYRFEVARAPVGACASN